MTKIQKQYHDEYFLHKALSIAFNGMAKMTRAFLMLKTIRDPYLELEYDQQELDASTGLNTMHKKAYE